jgi:hypothetical protein
MTARINAEEDQFFEGPCCVCRTWSPKMRSIGMLPFKSPTPGKGWGCFQCGLPSDGAIIVICDDCYELEGKPVLACAEYPKSSARVDVESLTVPHEHDRSKHPELEIDEAAKEGVQLMKESLESGGGLTAQVVDGALLDGLRMMRLVVCFGDLPIADFAVPSVELPDAAYIGEELILSFRIRACRKCGCTTTRACVSGCEWIELDLCSNCGTVLLDARGHPIV